MPKSTIKNTNLYFTILFIALFAINFLLGGVSQAATSTVRGAAWMGDIYKYVYFDCLDDVTGDRLDVLNNLSGADFIYHRTISFIFLRLLVSV